MSDVIIHKPFKRRGDIFLSLSSSSSYASSFDSEQCKNNQRKNWDMVALKAGRNGGKPLNKMHRKLTKD